MTADDNMAIVRRWNEEIWQGSETVYEELIAPGCIFHWMGGILEARQTIERVRIIFPDIAITIEDQFASGDRVATRWTLSGTHSGKLWSIPATGRRVTYTGITINRLRAGRIIEEWCEGNLLAILEQLGAVPRPHDGFINDN
jgi:predicted ester cyclase